MRHTGLSKSSLVCYLLNTMKMSLPSTARLASSPSGGCHGNVKQDAKSSWHKALTQWLIMIFYSALFVLSVDSRQVSPQRVSSIGYIEVRHMCIYMSQSPLTEGQVAARPASAGFISSSMKEKTACLYLATDSGTKTSHMSRLL